MVTLSRSVPLVPAAPLARVTFWELTFASIDWIAIVVRPPAAVGAVTLMTRCDQVPKRNAENGAVAGQCPAVG
jgi:hypothetical protein